MYNKMNCQLKNKSFDFIWYNQRDAHCLAEIAYYMQVLRVEAAKIFIPFMLFFQEINLWIPTEKTVYVTRKLKECVLEDGEVVKIVFRDNYTIT
jgi:hypothetical protein